MFGDLWGKRARLSKLFGLLGLKAEKHVGYLAKFILTEIYDGGKKEDKFFLEKMRGYTARRIWSKSSLTGLPIYIIISDFSEDKKDGGDQAGDSEQYVMAMLKCGDLMLPYDCAKYEKISDSKIDIAKTMLESLPNPPGEGFVLADSWYSCEAILKMAKQIGFDYIGSLKSNRKIFPKSHRRDGIQITEFVKTLKMSDLSLSQLDGEDCYTYVYSGKIKGVSKVKIVLRWPKDAPFEEESQRIYLSTSRELTTEQLTGHFLSASIPGATPMPQPKALLRNLAE
ncbi:MAG: hypothetical protein LBU32_32455 [Clostridiales bacterium]|jgi:hypothetical protein|nr:hypothetical protein [Clostridiales bacterium]